MSQPLLELKDVTRTFEAGGGLGIFKSNIIRAVDSVSFTITSEKPLITALVGESGSGKTTIARLILGLLEPTSGLILYKGKDLRWFKKKDWMTYLREVQPIFQDPYSAYNPLYRVERILRIVIKKFKLASSKSDTHEMMIRAMKDIGLRPEDILGRYPHQLSGGERQRLMLARILIISPKLLIADEPVSMIDASLRAIFLDQLKVFKEKKGTSCLYITHDLNMASYISDNIIVLCKGRGVEEGPTESVTEDPLHPYTKMLMDSISIPDPRERWKGRIELSSSSLFSGSEEAQGGCVFSATCPNATEKCTKESPNLTLIHEGSKRKVACFQR